MGFLYSLDFENRIRSWRFFRRPLSSSPVTHHYRSTSTESRSVPNNNKNCGSGSRVIRPCCFTSPMSRRRFDSKASLFKCTYSKNVVDYYKLVTHSEIAFLYCKNVTQEKSNILNLKQYFLKFKKISNILSQLEMNRIYGHIHWSQCLKFSKD